VLAAHARKKSEAALTRLSLSIAADVSREALQVFRQSIPLVLSTVNMQHTLRGAQGRNIRGTPFTLDPRQFLAWFTGRLELAVETRMRRFPANPRWLTPEGQMHGIQAATPQDYQDYAALVQVLCTPIRPGRPSGPEYFQNSEDFKAQILHIMRTLLRQGRTPTQSAVAEYLHVQTGARQMRRWLKPLHMRWADLLELARK
jgi:hypothetical protein